MSGLFFGVSYWLGRLAHARERLTCALKGHKPAGFPIVWCLRCGEDL